ncbi:hypothetical protein [Methylobacterium gnaphalii]|uniref:Uncharacterized protein n=1 Tax=Methylobacterium gnaphalii TaxID=1010610 RepID=A0A512JIL3_9HYPH|nr:hypothetical protein [Methylobacterium gnaphalii]GEP09774.1 hypothetical protein MGN01_16190 [Methylobacterium gnaphalii]GJD67310.1 hypothetical protein MMMDOFMJ_0224 [Methylobacterium gnaphalii]GLS49804.1 hypothetical protein GCM10007885_26560 [Methylobacterium gnaphalii]
MSGKWIEVVDRLRQVVPTVGGRSIHQGRGGGIPTLEGPNRPDPAARADRVIDMTLLGSGALSIAFAVTVGLLALVR